jgi:hypothetical protein
MYYQVVGSGLVLFNRRFMMKKRIFGLAAAALVLLSSCANFFTNSWGKNTARDPSTIKVTSGNVKDLLKEAKGDTKTSKGILDKITEQLKDNTDPASDPALRAAAVTAANQASGLGTVMLDSLDIILGDDVPTAETLNTLLETIQDKTKGNDLQSISKDVVDSLSVTTSNGKPVFHPDFIENTTEADLTLLTLTLVLAEAERVQDDFDTYIKTWTDGSKDLSTVAGLSDSEKVIAAAANGIISKGGTLADMLDGLFKK